MHLLIDSWGHEVGGALATQRPARAKIRADGHPSLLVHVLSFISVQVGTM
jgi:hypothetical protein